MKRYVLVFVGLVVCFGWGCGAVLAQGRLYLTIDGKRPGSVVTLEGERGYVIAVEADEPAEYKYDVAVGFFSPDLALGQFELEDVLSPNGSAQSLDPRLVEGYNLVANGEMPDEITLLTEQLAQHQDQLTQQQGQIAQHQGQLSLWGVLVHVNK